MITGPCDGRGREVTGTVVKGSFCSAVPHKLKFMKAVWEIQCPEVQTPRLETQHAVPRAWAEPRVKQLGCFIIIRDTVQANRSLGAVAGRS